MIDLNHIPSLSDKINAIIDAALESENAAQKPRDYIGPSAIGYSCERQVQYGFMGAAKDEGSDYKGGTLRIFQAGHVYEDVTIAEFRKAGFDLRTRKADGHSQIGFSAAGGRLRGHCDGVFVSGPPVFDYPALFEHKALGSKTFNKMKKDGVAVAAPYYAAQIAMYQAYLDLTENPAVFVCRNRDNQELYVELVQFDCALAQRMSDRAVRIIQATDAGELLPRIAAARDYFECRNCAYELRCWG